MLDSAVIDLAVAIGWQVSYETASELALSARKSGDKSLLSSDQGFLSNRLGLCWSLHISWLELAESLLELFFIDLAREAHSEAGGVSLSQLGGDLGDWQVLLGGVNAGVVHLILKDIP